jgi:transposase
MCSRKGEAEVIEIKLEPHRGMRGRCSQCQQPAPGYDRLPERRWQFVPLWGIRTDFLYAPRRVECAEHGVIVEHIPWSEGKRPVTCAMMGFALGATAQAGGRRRRCFRATGKQCTAR